MSSLFKLLILKISPVNLQNSASEQVQSPFNSSVSLMTIGLFLGITSLAAQASPLTKQSATARQAETVMSLASMSATSLGAPIAVTTQPIAPGLPLPYQVPVDSRSQSIAQNQALPTPSQLPPSQLPGTLPPAPTGYFSYPNPAGYPNSYAMPGAYGRYPTQGYVYTSPQAPSAYYPQQPYPQQPYSAPSTYAVPQYPSPQMGYGMPAYPVQPMPTGGGYYSQQQPYQQPYPQQPYQQPYPQQPYQQPYPQQPYQQPYPQQQPYQQPYPQQPYAGMPGYGVPSYGMPSYGYPGYASPGYAVPMGYPNYAMPAYISPMQAVTVLPPVAAPVTVRQIAPNFSSAPIAPNLYAPNLYAEAPLRSPVDKEGFLIEPGKAQQLQTQNRPLFRTTALTKPSLILQGAYVYQGGDSSARARLRGLYPLSSRVLFGVTVDLSTGNSFSDTLSSGLNISELYLATSLPEIPNLRFAAGQLDLTSYFDRNSFAKDGTTHFFNPIFQTNPALAEVGIGSRPGLIANWSLTDNIEIKGAAYSSARGLGDFALNGFAGEVGFRYGNAIIRGTYASGRADANGGGFKEAFQIARGGGQFGVLKGDREEGFGVNAEVFFPRLKMGVFGRYGRYNNLDLNEGGDTASVGLSFLDIFAPDDRLGLAYGQGLSNDSRRVSSGGNRPDVLELFYDFKFMPNLRMGFSLQERNSFSEIVAGFRVKTEFDVTPRGAEK